MSSRSLRIPCRRRPPTASGVLFMWRQISATDIPSTMLQDDRLGLGLGEFREHRRPG